MFWLTFDFLLQADGQSDSAQKLFGPKKMSEQFGGQ